MKKTTRKVIAATVISTVSIALLAGGCGKKTEIKETDEKALSMLSEVMEDASEIIESVELSNPMIELSAEDQAMSGIGLEAPQGAEEVHYYIIDPGVETETISQVSFILNGVAYDYRAQACDAVEAVDISGIFSSESTTTHEDVAGRNATMSINPDGSGCIYWLDEVTGIDYCLGCAKDCSEDTLLALANQIFQPMQGEVDGDDISIAGSYKDSADDECNTIDITENEDGTYTVSCGIYRLCSMDGTGTLEGDTLNIEFTDSADEPMKATLCPGENGLDLTITESTWDLLETGTVFGGFVLAE